MTSHRRNESHCPFQALIIPTLPYSAWLANATFLISPPAFNYPMYNTCPKIPSLIFPIATFPPCTAPHSLPRLTTKDLATSVSFVYHVVPPCTLSVFFVFFFFFFFFVFIFLTFFSSVSGLFGFFIHLTFVFHSPIHRKKFPLVPFPSTSPQTFLPILSREAGLPRHRF